jgi:hypothetical protein
MTVIESFRNSSTILFFQPSFSSFTIVEPRVLEGGAGFSHHGARAAPNEPLSYPKFGSGNTDTIPVNRLDWVVRVTPGGV